MEQSMVDAPVLSVVIPTWNRATMVEEAVESAIAQDCPEFIEIIVVDDDSTDETQAVLADLGRRRSPTNRLLRILHTDHCGRTGAAQRGIDVASAPYAAILGSDDAWEPQRARELLTEQRRLGGNALIYTNTKEANACGVVISDEPACVRLSGMAALSPGWQTDPFPLRSLVTSVFSANAFPYPACVAIFPTHMLTGRFSLPQGIPSPDFWFLIAGHLQCVVAYLDTFSMRRRIHSGQQHRLAEAHLCHGEVDEQIRLSTAVISLLEDTVPQESAMISVMKYRLQLVLLRRGTLQGNRLTCLTGSVSMARHALRFPGLWRTIASNILLALWPRLHDFVRYYPRRRRLALAIRQEHLQDGRSS